jgi:hypothetical protein
MLFFPWATVTTTQEATLDSKVLVAAADLSVQRAARMKIAGKAFDVDEFIDKLVTKMGGRNIGGGREEAGDDDGDLSGRRQRRNGDGLLDWFALGTAVAKSMQRAPTIDFLYVE